MIRRLTLEQRAQRRARRKSNQVRRAYPLLAQAGVIEGWMTTPAEAQAQLERIDRDAQAQLARLCEARARDRLLAQQLRAQVAAQVDGPTLVLLDEHLAAVYPPSYASGFWRRVLAGQFDIYAWRADLERIRRLGEQARRAPAGAV